MDYKNLMDLYTNKVKEEEVPEYFEAPPMTPDQLVATPGRTDEEIAQANDIIEAPNAYDQQPESSVPEITPPVVDDTGINQAEQAVKNFDATQLPDADKSITEEDEEEKVKPLTRDQQLQELLAKFEERKAESVGERERAKMEDAFRLMNKSLAGRGGLGAPKLGPSAVSQLPKDQGLQELMAKYKILSGEKKLDIAEEKAKQKTETKKPTVIEKELAKAEAKDTVQMRKENRALKKDMESSVKTLDEQLANVKKAKELIKNAKGMTGTGPVDQYLGKFTDKGQKIEQALNKISLDTMVKMFSGMSKAIDSDAERAFFQSAQPSMGKYETVNMDILNEMEEKIKGLKNKTQSAMGTINEKGEKKQVKAAEHSQTSEAEAWALANPDDPRAEKILKRLGK